MLLRNVGRDEERRLLELQSQGADQGREVDLEQATVRYP